MSKGFLKRDVNMLEGSIVKGLLTISIPIMIMNVTQSLFNIVDMTVLKNFASDENVVGAVGVCSSLISLITGLLIGCSSGANVVIARRIGRGDKEGSKKAVGTAIAFAFLGGVFISLVGIFGAELFLTWTNCPANHLKNAILYFRLYFAGVPILMVYNFSAAILRSTGDSSRPMIYLMTGGVVKVLFNIVFVAVLNLSVVGVALATIISWSVSCALGLRALFKNENEMTRLSASKLKFSKRELCDILEIGIPAGLQQALYSIANVIITAAVNSIDPETGYAATGMSIANNFDGILYQIACAPAYAVMPYVSQNLGANNLTRAKKAITRGMMIAVLFAGTIGALSAIFSGPLSSIMSSNPEVIKYSQQKMVIISSTYFICGINQILSETMRGFRRPMIPTTATLLFMCALRFFWVYVLFPHFPEPKLTFLYLVWPVGWVLSIIMVLCYLIPTIRGNWQKRFHF